MNCDSNRTYTLEDLRGWDSSGVSLAVVGHPIRHSLSPVMHNAALREMAGQDARFKEWCYYRFDINPRDLDEALDLFGKKGFRGLNLTVPHKVLAMGSVGHISEEALLIGAVNTLVRSGDAWHGYNTDAYGMSRGIEESFGFSLKGADVLLLGCGGAARAAVVECIREKSSSVTVINRTQANLDAFISDFRSYASANGVSLTGIGSDLDRGSVPSRLLVINATSLGLHAGDLSPFDLTMLKDVRAVFDMIYNPPQTQLLRQAVELSVPCANGLAMLLYQGVRALEYWAEGFKIPVETMRFALLAEMNRRQP